ncbi:hypothetical protein D918_02341 [Trichuris suis]|nr:hypothetical protein D918_02341 [Trichuris suis]
MRTSISQKTTNVTPRYREVNFLTVNCGKKLLESTVTLQFVPQECSFSDMKIIEFKIEMSKELRMHVMQSVKNLTNKAGCLFLA